MLKKIIEKRWMFIAIVLILAGAASLFLGRVAASQDKESEYFQKFQETVVLYEKVATLEGQERLDALALIENSYIGIASKTQNDKLSAAAFYNAGTISLNEFLADNENLQSLKSAILYLQESLIKDPGQDRAKRNLEIAWRQVTQNDLADDLGLKPVDGAGGDGNNKQEGGGQGKEDGEKDGGGSESTDEPLPYDEKEGFGRGNEYKDY